MFIRIVENLVHLFYTRGSCLNICRNHHIVVEIEKPFTKSEGDKMDTEDKGGGGGGGTESESDWAELTHECLINIFSRLSFEDRWRRVLFVCKSWLQASGDPILNTIFDLEPQFGSVTESPRWWIPSFETKIDNMLRSAVNRSDGALTQIRVRHCSDRSLRLVAERYSSSI